MKKTEILFKLFLALLMIISFTPNVYGKVTKDSFSTNLSSIIKTTKDSKNTKEDTVSIQNKSYSSKDTTDTKYVPTVSFDVKDYNNITKDDALVLNWEPYPDMKSYKIEVGFPSNSKPDIHCDEWGSSETKNFRMNLLSILDDLKNYTTNNVITLKIIGCGYKKDIENFEYPEVTITYDEKYKYFFIDYNNIQIYNAIFGTKVDIKPTYNDIDDKFYMAPINWERIKNQ